MKTLLIAHRGAQTVVPENTLEAFALALRRGFRAVECDVQLTKDGHLVVIHDETIERTLPGAGWVSRKTLTDLRALSGPTGGRIPLLSEVVRLVAARRRRLIIEIKADSEAHARLTARALARFLKTVPARQRRLLEVHSFWYEALAECKQLMPAGIRTAAIINGGFSADQIIELAQAVGADGVSLGYEFLSRQQVRQCHKAGLFVDCWAVSDRTVMRRLRPFGLNGIIENFTGRVIS